MREVFRGDASIISGLSFKRLPAKLPAGWYVKAAEMFTASYVGEANIDEVLRMKIVSP
jgi:hypothetical protein